VSTPARACDGELALDDPDPLLGAAAMDLCDVSVAGSPGVVSAEYLTVDGADDLADVSNGLLGVGLLDEFGPNVAPQQGARMLALSTGSARSPLDPSFQSPSGYAKGYLSEPPAGLPYEMPACPGVTTGQPYDSAALRLVLQAPADANSFSFRFKFHTFEYPGFLCSSFNDWFVALVAPAPPGAHPGGNVAFDSAGNPVTVNTPELLTVCEAGSPGGASFPCPDGVAELAGTGFEEHAATGWLRTTVPITAGGSFALTLGIWDSGDGILDATALIDDFRWSAASAEAPSTVPAPEPGSTARLLAAGLALVAVVSARGRRGAPASVGGP
jgi:hypothetical protein